MVARTSESLHPDLLGAGGVSCAMRVLLDTLLGEVVSNPGMRFRWRVVLPSCGLLLFAIVTYQSTLANRGFHSRPGRYFWWSAIRLDSDPLNRHSAARTAIACPDKVENCMPLEPIEIWIDPGWLTKCFMLLALPALLAAEGIVRGMARLGVSEIISFFVSMPPLIVAWLCSVGWVLDRWRSNRART